MGGDLVSIIMLSHDSWGQAPRLSLKGQVWKYSHHRTQRCLKASLDIGRAVPLFVFFDDYTKDIGHQLAQNLQTHIALQASLTFQIFIDQKKSLYRNYPRSCTASVSAPATWQTTDKRSYLPRGRGRTLILHSYQGRLSYTVLLF
jgi:hypothetical protein